MKLLSQEDLERSNAQWEEFARLVSHDLKAPLRAVENLAQWVQEDLGNSASAEVAENLTLLRQRARRMAALLEDLLEYSRVGSESHEAIEIDLGELVAELVKSLPSRPGLQLRIATDLPRFKASHKPLSRALSCLLSNAFKHHDKAAGTVEFSARELGSEIEMILRDDGPGIEERHQERIFKVFQTLKPRDEVEGSGMGLALLKRILDAHGGSVSLDSAPAKGSTFTIRWPKGR